jgi:hypothetical protein
VSKRGCEWLRGRPDAVESRISYELSQSIWIFYLETLFERSGGSSMNSKF